MANPIATKCVTDVVTRIETVPEMKGKTFHVMSDQELLDKTKGLMYSCVAVIYGGITSVAEDGDTGKKGVSCELSMDVILFFRGNAQAQNDPKVGAVAMLDTMRDKMREGRSPSGHFWRFQSERAIELKTGLMGYMQRWTTPVQMV